MNNRERKNKNSGFVGIAVIAAIALLEGVVDAITGAKILGLIIPIVFIAILGAVLGLVLGRKKKAVVKTKINGYQAERSREAAKRIFMREEFEEQAVKCAHPRGREKYIHQLDGFLANGLIDKNEYRVLKERYEKVVIPENMH